MKHNEIKFLRITHLRGPNIWTYRPVLEAWVDIGDLEDFPSNTIPGLYERLQTWLPGMIEHRCGVGERGGFFKRLQEGTWAAHILEHVTIELQNLAGMPTGFGKAREAGPRGIYKVAIRTREETVGRACLDAGRDLLMAAINDTPFDLQGTVLRLRDLADRRLLGPSTTAIVDSASHRRIPHLRLTEGNLVQLGYGRKQRRIWTAETDRTSAIAESISRDKDLTKSLLASCGVPVPEGRLVDSPEDAWAAAEDVGLPVVVKPWDGNHGRGVFTNLNQRDEVEAAYRAAREEGSGVIVERFIEGNEHRLLIVGGKLAAANRGLSAHVTGDGHSSIRELVEVQLNSDPRRGDTEEFPLSIIRLEEEPVAMLEIARQGFSPEAVPPAGEKVLILRHSSLAFDCTDDVHPEVAAAAVLAAQIVGLDIAGVDMVTKDISRPLEEQHGAIVEVNAGPGLLMHLKPAEGKPRPVGQAIVDHLFPSGENGRIPVIGIVGHRQTTLIARLLARLLNLAGNHVGLACTAGVFLDGRQITASPGDNFAAGERLLINRSIDAAVCETSARSILAEGLPYDRCQVGIVTDVSGQEELGDFYIDSEERLINVLRTQIDVVLPEGVAVLNAGDARAAGMAGLSDGAVIFYALDPEAPPLAEHLARGNRAVVARLGQIELLAGNEREVLAPLARFALTGGNTATEEQIEAVLATVAASWALEVPAPLITAGIECFEQEQAAETAVLSST